MRASGNCDSVSAVIGALNELLTVFEDAENSIYETMAECLSKDDANASGKLPSSLSECHILHYIGRGENIDGEHTSVNGKTLSKLMRMTKGGVSKLAAKLQKKGLILSDQPPENRREIRYSLTDDGWKIFRLHAELHDSVHANLTQLIQEYDENDLLLIDDFLRKVIDIGSAPEIKR